jgi:hypothetical protein
MLLDVAHQLQVPLEGDIRVVTALEKNLYPAQCLTLVDLGTNLLEAENVTFPMLGPAIERAELTVGDTDVSVVDVSVDDISDDVFRVLAPPLGVRQLPELEE